MKNLIFLLTVSSIFILNSCNVFQGNNNKLKSCEILTVDKNFNAADYKSDYKINTVTLKDSLLTINLTYNGNSNNDDEFDLVFNGMYAKSMPPIATLFLVQKETGSKEITRDVCFDISNIKYKGGKTIVKVNGIDQKLMYTY